MTEQKGNLHKWEPIFSGICVILLAILAYLLLAGQLGFYRDDWYMIWAAKTGGIGRLFQMFKIDRPLLGLISGVNYWLVGDSTLRWQIYAVFIRILSTLGFLGLVRQVWPNHKIATLSMAAVFIVYPGFSQQNIALTYSNLLLGYTLSIYSVLFTILALKQNKPILRWLYIFLSMGTAITYLLVAEYLIGMEAVRVMLLVTINFQSGIRKFQQIIKKTLPQWVPSSIPLAVFLVWRLFIFKSARHATDLGRLVNSYFKDPIGMGLRVIVEGLKDFFETVYLAWFIPLYRFTSQATTETLLIGLGAAFLGISLVAIYWYLHFKKSNSTSDQTKVDQQFNYQEFLIIGSLWTLFTIFPVVLSERQVLFQGMSDRYTLHVTAGIAVFLIGNIYFLFSSHRVRFGFVALLIGIGVLTNFLNGVDYANFWKYQRQAWWQLSWRAPSLKSGTSLVLGLPSQYSIAEGYEVWAPANLIYSEDPDELRVGGDVLNLTTLPLINQPRTIERNTRTIIVKSDFTNSLVMGLNYRGCLHIYDRSWLGFPVNEDPMIQMTASNSIIELIEAFSPERKISVEIFGPEPEHNWCYFYQKAGLAAQQENWNEVSRLGDEAAKLGLKPNLGYEMEWMPFYEGYLHAHEVAKAENLSKQIRSSSDFIISFCGRKENLAVESQNDEVRASIFETLCYEFYQ